MHAPPSIPQIGKALEEPRLEEIVEAIRQAKCPLPVPLRPFPRQKPAKSVRLRQRAARRREVHRIANDILEGVNRTLAGNMQPVASGHPGRVDLRGSGTAAGQIQLRASRHAQDSASVRRPERATGVQAISGLLKLAEVNYTGFLKKEVHMEFIADRIDEITSTRSVDMLQALLEPEALFYSRESNVVDWNGKSVAQQKELEQQCFLSRQNRGVGSISGPSRPPSGLMRILLACRGQSDKWTVGGEEE